MTSTDPSHLAWIEFEKAHPIVVPPVLESPHLLTRKTASANGWPIEPPIEEPKLGSYDFFRVYAREHNRDRALRLIDAILKACDARGFQLRHNPARRDHAGISVFVDDEPIAVALIERGTVVTHLSLELESVYRASAWKDRLHRPLERRLNDLMLRFRSISETRKFCRRDRDEADRKHEEHLRQRSELRQRLKDERNAVKTLLSEAESWQRAENIRAYVAAFRKQTRREGTIADYKNWIDWANDQADRIDPLQPSPSSILDTPRDAYREPGWEEYIDDDGNIAQA